MINAKTFIRNKMTEKELNELTEKLVEHRTENAEPSDLKRLYYDNMDGYYSGLSEEDVIEEAEAYDVIETIGEEIPQLLDIKVIQDIDSGDGKTHSFILSTITSVTGIITKEEKDFFNIINTGGGVSIFEDDEGTLKDRRMQILDAISVFVNEVFDKQNVHSVEKYDENVRVEKELLMEIRDNTKKDIVMKKDKDIERILQKIDWRKIELVMEQLKWYWRNDSQIPSRTELVRTGRHLLDQALNHKDENSRVSTGGLCATRQYYKSTGNTVLQLDFIIESQFDNLVFGV